MSADMLSSFFVPLMVLNVALLAHPLLAEPRRYAIALVTAVAMATVEAPATRSRTLVLGRRR